MQGDQGDIHTNGGNHGLQDTDDGSLLSGLLQSRQTEFMTNGKGDEAQGHVRDHGQGVHLIRGVEAQAGYSQTTEHAGSDQDTGYQIGGNVRQAEFDKKPCHQQTGKEGKSKQQKCLHKRLRFLSEIHCVSNRTPTNCITKSGKSQ